MTKMLLVAGAFCAPILFFSAPAYAEAKASSIILTVSPDLPLSLEMLPSPSGTFAETDNKTIDVQTDNFSGYTLKISSQSSRSLVAIDPENDDTIDSISSVLSESDFRNSANYNNKFGYKPSMIDNNGTIVTNTNFLPIPSTTGDIIDRTSVANNTNNSYTLSFGVKIDFSLTPGDYSYTYIISAVGNDSVYNISYDENTNDAVAGMPSPNPQAITIAAGTPAVDSYGILSSSAPIREDYSFGGWCDETPTLNAMTNNQECGGTTYQPGDHYEIDQTDDGTNITLYAIWIDDEFPVVWSQMGVCEFHGMGTGEGIDGQEYLITGSECQDYADKRFIDTGIALYSDANYQKDYEVHFTINEFDPTHQSETQATLFNDKLSTSVTEAPYEKGAPGIVVRENSSHGLEIKSNYGPDVHGQAEHNASRYVDKTPRATAYAGTDIRILRIDGIIYTSVDNGPLIQLQDYTSFSQQFGLTAWFGAYPDNVDCTESCTEAKRFLEGELSNMYIKLGDFPADGKHAITFNANSGASTTSVTILDGNSLGELPVVTKDGWMFDGWYTQQTGGQKITSSTVPDADTTYWAHWVLSVSEALIMNTDVQLSVNDTETIAITNAEDIESYTLVSSDSSVATVDQSTGVITAVGNGTATITMTGEKTGDTRTINVTVGALINVDFDSQGGTPSTYTLSVGSGNSFNSLPEPTKAGYSLEGWYTGTNGSGTKLTTSTVFDQNAPTQYYANWTEEIYVCKIAKQLHEETCGWANNQSLGCVNAGFSNGDTITYGNLVESTTMNYGDAYNCNVNNDSEWSESTERFYYIGSNDGVASFVYYNNSPDINLNYASALDSIPNSDSYDNTWTNPGLQTIGSKVTRFMTVDEVRTICNGDSGIGTRIGDTNKGKCGYLAENTSYAYTEGKLDTIWLQQVNGANRRIHMKDGRKIATPSITNSVNGPRVVIEVPLELVEQYEIPSATDVTVTFNSMGGSTISSVEIQAGTALGDKYPDTDPTKTDNRFFGWYTDTTFSTEVTPETVVTGNVTYYARWIGDTTRFPIKFAEINACEFNGGDPITGTYCSQSEQSKLLGYIDTNIKLFTATDNAYQKDFEIGFTIVEYDPNAQGASNTQATLVNSKAEMTGYPGFVMRRNNSNFQLTAKFGNSGNPQDKSVAYSSIKHVRIARRSGKMYYAWNDNELTLWHDISNFSTRFETEVWFGAATDSNEDPWRWLTGTLTDMYIRVGVYEDSSTNTYTIQFDANGGEITSGTASAQINQGDPIGSFPTVARGGNFTFAGWFDSEDNEVTTSTIPDKSQTYHAEWLNNSSKTPVTLDVSNAALSGYQTIVDGYQPQITTFNEADPINNSTWGVAKSTYLGALQTNFETKNCMAVPQEDSQIDWGGSHTVNCSKPNAYDTGVSTGVTVYEYDVANDSIGQQPIAYAKSENGVIHNLVPGKDYYWVDSNDSSVYGVISAISSANNRRLIDAGDIWNVRDLGGLPVDTNGDGTVDGTIEYGKLIRGGRLNTASSNITELQNLGIDKEYNLAGATELDPDVKFSGSSYINDEVIHYNFDYGTIVDNENTYDMARQAVTDIMNDVINGNNVYFHCRVGADRTGTVAYILEGLLGVPDEQRYQDFEITSVSGLNDRTRYYAEKSSTNNKKFLFMMGYLKTNADIVNWYFKDASDTGAQARITAFKNAMITSSASSSPNNSQQSLNNMQQLSAGNNSILANNANTVNLANTNVNDATTEDKSEDSYSNPLGVSKASDGSNKTINTSVDYSAAVGTVIAATSIIALGGTAHSLAKQMNGD